MKAAWNKVIWGLAALALTGLLAYGFLPAPVIVETARVERGPLRVTVDEDGKTRIRERYVVSAPLTGQLRRIDVHAGDSIVAGQTLLALIDPRDPALLDARALAEAEARVRAAQAAHQQAQAKQGMAHNALALARHTYERAKELIVKRVVSQEDFDAAEHKERIAAEDLRAADFGVQLARFELEQAQAALLYARPELGQASATSAPFEIRAPVSGKVLRVLQESAAVVEAGARLVEVGDSTDLELEIDILSADAVKIKPGAKVLVEAWGGEQSLAGHVRVVEPSGFLKVSALGVEEQRVYVIATLDSPPAERPALGDGYRVEAKIVVWEDDPVLKVRAGALFRQGGDWTVFALDGGRAQSVQVEIGHNNGHEAEVLSGLEENQSVILHPSDRIATNVRVRAQEIGK